ncbi:phospholipase D-like domain-containing protein [Microcoleus sp. FACHB-68]|uniref:phospholipase D-like domain-containing protein n=1 Tax=Microcoleus sp. FACHB-68 TaxID=2692826 RepID=UPI001683706D|nr:phospholipase D-like domain-containing protein [Microcoleus sp. FACHB-68]MBD1939064.1 hypothetical protein [Microcoleus sp. FACHB-68]
MVTMLLPLNRYQVKYELAEGRPYSKLDQLVLRAFKEEKAKTIQDLQDIFCLPNRLLVEVIVTLAQAGWIAISHDKEGSFILTRQGTAVLGTPDQQLPPGTSIRSEMAFIIMERFTGELVSPNEIIYQNTTQLKDDKIGEKTVCDIACKLPNKIIDKSLGIEQVQHLLRRKSGERIRFIAPPALVSQNYYWLAMNADIEQQRVIGLPDCWEGSLKQLLLEEAEKFAQKYPERAKASYVKVRSIDRTDRTRQTSEEFAGSYSTKIDLNDLLLTHTTHVQQLGKALTEEAKTDIIITSAFLKIDNLSDVKDWVIKALERGVNVSLLWGYKDDNNSEKRTKEWLEGLQKQAKKLKRGNLHFNEIPTNSHAKLLIYDTEEGYQAYVGSYNWLSKPTKVEGSPSDFNGSDVTIRLRHPGLVADLCRSVAGLWDTEQNSLSSNSPGRWQQIAADLQEQIDLYKTKEMQKADELPTSTVRIVHAREHAALMRQYLQKAQKRCLVVSHQIDPDEQVAGFRLINPLQKRSNNLESLIVLYGDKERLGQKETDFPQQVAQIKGVLEYKQGCHSKVFIVDESAIISSYNFLSGDPFNKAKRLKEIGILIEGGEVPAKLWAVFSALSDGMKG